MRIIREEQIISLGIEPQTCVDWIEESFKAKLEADLPPKISVHPFPDSFYTAMPCFHPDTGRVGVKVISRVPGSIPALKSKLMLFDAKSGDLLALIDTNWITAMRTGAVAALAAKTFSSNFGNASFGIVGLGVIGKATIDCLISICHSDQSIWLMQYKDQADNIICQFPEVKFNVAKTKEELVDNTNTLFSCVTVMHEQFMNEAYYPNGYTLIPVHVRGFQDCDITFDKIFGDDAEHMKSWQNFSKFRYFAEFTDVLLGKKDGRTSDNERIISYNYGLGLHDLWFASRIYDMINSERSKR